MGNAVRRVLVVEDSPSMRGLLQMVAEAISDVTVETAEDGFRAIHLVRQAEQVYDLIFLDLNMPIMDGMKFLHVLRSFPEGQYPRVVVITTEHGADTEAKARRLGANAFIAKPIRPDQLRKVLLEELESDGLDDRPSSAPDPE